MACVFVSIAGEGKIIETATVEHIVPLIDADTWLLVDLDNTMFEGKQALGHTEWFYDKAYALMRETGMSLEEATRQCYPEWIEIQKVCPVKPVEAAFVPTLMGLQEKHFVMMGLTHRQPSLAESTNRQLLSLGWTFVDSAPVAGTFEVPSQTPTLFTHGVLFTGEYNKKGEMFVQFLRLINQKPKKIVFIDDKRSHVEEVERAVRAENIDYIGVHYTAIQHAEKVYDPEIAEFQRKQLNTILSNEAALLLMQNPQD
jgi:hypothetical protein